MPAEEELFEEKPSAPAQLAPQAPQQESPAEIDKPSQPYTKTASFKQMFAHAEENGVADDQAIDYGKEESELEQPSLEPEPNENEGNLAMAQLAKTRIASRNPAKILTRGLSKLHPRKDDKSEEVETSPPEGQLAIDVYETPTEVVIKSTIAGVKSSDLDVGIEDNTINIRGSRHNEEKVKGEDYFYQECYWGTFSRSVILPVEIDSDKVQASLKDGILTIRLPKILKEKEKKIKILS